MRIGSRVIMLCSLLPLVLMGLSICDGSFVFAGMLAMMAIFIILAGKCGVVRIEKEMLYYRLGLFSVATMEQRKRILKMKLRV